jgi:hypothetical protein
MQKGEEEMIARVWRGWTAHQNADAFEAVLRTQSIPNILARSIPGLREAQVLRLERLGETEFVTMLWFDDMDAVRALASARGIAEEDYEKSIISFPARELLRRFDFKVEHYEVREIVRPVAASSMITARAAMRGA